jgi:hypothetical protein
LLTNGLASWQNKSQKERQRSQCAHSDSIHDNPPLSRSTNPARSGALSLEPAQACGVVSNV